MAISLAALLAVHSLGLKKAGLAETTSHQDIHWVDPALAARARYVRKMVTQLPSKMRFVAAQFNALLDGELWLRNARHSNAMATLLYDAVADLDAVEVAKPQVNGLFPTLPADAIAPLQAWSFFWDWDVANRQVRWMTSWDTTADDVEHFASGVAAAVSSADVTSGTPVGN